jgi:hypothetical protein
VASNGDVWMSGEAGEREEDLMQTDILDVVAKVPTRC